MAATLAAATGSTKRSPSDTATSTYSLLTASPFAIGAATFETTPVSEIETTEPPSTSPVAPEKRATRSSSRSTDASAVSPLLADGPALNLAAVASYTTVLPSTRTDALSQSPSEVSAIVVKSVR